MMMNKPRSTFHRPKKLQQNLLILLELFISEIEFAGLAQAERGLSAFPDVIS